MKMNLKTPSNLYEPLEHKDELHSCNFAEFVLAFESLANWMTFVLVQITHSANTR